MPQKMGNCFLQREENKQVGSVDQDGQGEGKSRSYQEGRGEAADVARQGTTRAAGALTWGCWKQRILGRLRGESSSLGLVKKLAKRWFFWEALSYEITNSGKIFMKAQIYST